MDARVNNTAVVSAGFLAILGILLKNQDTFSLFRNPRRNSQANYASPDHNNIRLFHRQPSNVQVFVIDDLTFAVKLYPNQPTTAFCIGF
jgi:hypothetical protein